MIHQHDHVRTIASRRTRVSAPPPASVAAPGSLPVPALRATPRRAAIWLGGATAVVATLGVVAAVCRIGFGIEHGPINFIALIDFEAESSLPAWYTSCLLLVSAALLGLVGFVKARQRARFVRHWLALGFIFLLLSADETIQFHERAAWPAERILKLKGAFLYGWVIPAILFVTVVGLSYLKFLAHLPARTRWRFVLAGATYVGAALGLEMVEGVLHTRFGMADAAYVSVVAVEETLEMAGIVLFITSLLGYAQAEWKALTIAFEPGEAPANALADAPHDPSPAPHALTAGRPGSAPPDRAAAPASTQPSRLGV